MDAVYPLPLAPLLLGWALPPGLPVQISSRVLLVAPTSTSSNATIYDSGWVASSAPRATVARSLLEPAREYAWSVAIQGTGGNASDWSQPQRFFTSGGSATWAASAPIWAPSCAGAAGPPKFARFHADISLASAPASKAVLSALLYITGSPPIYADPWNVTKILGGYKLAVNGTVLGVGPGRTSCGPLRPGVVNQVSEGAGTGALPLCSPIQPVDGYDVSAHLRAALALSAPFTLDIASYGLIQPAFGLVPAVQASLHVRWAPLGSAPDLILGTGPGAPWVALDADSLYNPNGNKAPFWYHQPREDFNASCLPAPPGSGSATPPAAAGCNGACGWVAPAANPGAWLNGSIPLAGKTTQGLSFLRHAPVADASVQLGVGWWLLDSGGEFQGGVRVELTPSAAVPPAGAWATVQLSSQLAANGSALWNSRAGNHYQDFWTFPAAGRPEQRAIEHHEC